VLLAARHARRLWRDARRLGLTGLPEQACLEALEALARESFPERAGCVRLEARDDGRGRACLVGSARELGPEPAAWSAVLSPLPHPGPSAWPGAKLTARAFYERAVRDAATAGADEALLLDAEGRLVEGARTNLVVALGPHDLRTPALARGAVAGVARELALERVPELREADVAAGELRGARELLALNAVRGAVAVVRLDGRAVGDGRPGPWAARLALALRDAPADPG
jgi:branched-subunit amino acid aminotransferase/4-amino-4-deoxychorismate lyase